jgi:hypothetical protein
VVLAIQQLHRPRPAARRKRPRTAVTLEPRRRPIRQSSAEVSLRRRAGAPACHRQEAPCLPRCSRGLAPTSHPAGATAARAAGTTGAPERIPFWHSRWLAHAVLKAAWAGGLLGLVEGLWTAISGAVLR